MKRVIITGANGSGKSHVAARLKAARPDVLLVSFDAIKLKSDWIQRPKVEIEVDLAKVVAGDVWILEGGPSLLPTALPRADAVIWLDPPFTVRAWRLFTRPLKTRGTTRVELPDGNPDHIAEQYRFAWRSLRKTVAFRTGIANTLSGADIPVIACYTRVDVDSAVALWIKG
jgi:adenylate kinase family enzyme